MLTLVLLRGGGLNPPTKPLDTHVNCEIWVYFTKQKKNQIFTFSVVFTYLKKVGWFNPPSDIRVKKTPSEVSLRAWHIYLYDNDPVIFFFL